MWANTSPIDRGDHGWCADRVTDDCRSRTIGAAVSRALSWRTNWRAGDCRCSISDALRPLIGQESRPSLGRPTCVNGVHPTWGGRNDPMLGNIVRFVERHRGGHDTCHILWSDTTRARGHLIPWDPKIGRIRVR